MTASITTPAAVGAANTTGIGRLPGFGGLLRKEIAEWRHAKRGWVVLVVSGLFMTLTSLNAWLQANVLPEDVTEAVPDPIVDPLINVLISVQSQIFLVVAAFAVMSLIVAERESGTLAWTASKPVSRTAILLAKFASASGILWLLAGLVPLAATVAMVAALYGGVPILPILVVAMGMGMGITFFVALGLATATVWSTQAAVAGIGVAVMFVPELLGAVIPVAEYLPTSIVKWSIMSAVGEPAGFVTVISWAVATVALVAFAARRMERMEL
jgi:ABC-type transport system involved in multi-copper enzyme maturation permease subunit